MTRNTKIKQEVTQWRQTQTQVEHEEITKRQQQTVNELNNEQTGHQPNVKDMTSCPFRDVHT